MKKLLFSLALLMGMASLGNAVLNACGAKFLVSSRGARYQRLLASIKPTRILIYWKQDENTKKEDRWNPEATKVLGKVGHSVEVAFRSDAFLDAAEEGDFDVVMMPLDDARQLAVKVASSSPDSGLLQEPIRGGPGKLDHLLRWLRPESERMRSHGKTKEFLSSVLKRRWRWKRFEANAP